MIIHPRQTIALGASTAFVAQLLASAMALLGTLVVSRALGPDGRGQVAVAIAASSSFWAVCQLSLEFSNTYFSAQRLFTLRTIAGINSSMALLIVPVAFALQALFFLVAHDTVFAGVGATPVLVAAATVPFSVHLVWLMNLFQLESRLIRSQAALVAGAAAQFIGVLVLAVLGQLTVVSALALYAANIVGAWFLHVVWGRSFAAVKPTFDLSKVRQIVSYGLRLHPSFLFWFLLMRVDILLVNALLDTRSAGLYSIATIVAEIILLLSAPIAAAVLPVQSAQSVREAAGVTFKAVRFNLLLATVLSIGFASTMWFLIPLVFGERFTPAYVLMLSLLPGMIAMAVYRPLYSWLIRQQQARRLALVTGLAFFGNVALTVLLLPAVGVIGAGIVSSIAYVGLAAALISWGLRIAGFSARDALVLRKEDIDTLRHHGGVAWRVIRRAVAR